MWPDLVSKPGPLTYESGALPNALRGPACPLGSSLIHHKALRRGQTTLVSVSFYQGQEFLNSHLAG